MLGGVPVSRSAPGKRDSREGGAGRQNGPSDRGELQAVHGIGPKVEARLKEAGITSLRELARTPVNEIAAALAGLRGRFDTDRIVREGWTTQAAALASTSTPSEAGGEAAPKPVRHSFTVEVRLPMADRDIVSSKVVHVQTGDEEVWGGWDPQRLVAFIEDRSRAHASAGPSGSQPDSPAPQPVPAPAASDQSPPMPSPAAPGRRQRKAVLRTYEVVPVSGPHALAQGRELTATLSFDAPPLEPSPGEVATVKAEVFARQLVAGTSLLVGGSLAAIGWREHFRADIPCDLSAVARPVTIYAVVLVLADDDGSRRAVRGLPGARLVLSPAARHRGAAPLTAVR